ncbi:hypothetical protein [Salinigranum salinum]|uniref:hypothetical protein n=1 Tax=Salinigranum salinum TaxID=1364937 RepID=UPI0018640DB3|nr:hypothetical protein [Salinigranum salinum]
MRAREWLIAFRYGCPAEYGVPTLPSWEQCRDEDGRLALRERDADEPFISAANPVTVRR